jgi:prepilin-type processing-associated H-X9-DG protein
MRARAVSLIVAFEFLVLLMVLACTIALLVIGLMRRRDSWIYGGLAAVSATILLAFAALLFAPEIGHRPSMTATCIGNLSTLSRALLIYEGDYDGMTPPARWVEILRAYYVDSAELKCPLDGSPVGYALNRHIVDIDSDLILNPSKTVAFFDAVGSTDHTGGVDAIVWRHSDERAVFSFADGHCRAYKRAERPSLDVVIDGE